MSKISRRTFLKTTLVGLAGTGAAGFGAAAYVTQIEPYRLTLSELTIAIPHLPPAFEGFTIAHITDWHLGEWMTPQYMLEMVSRVNALRPDLIAVTGDLISRGQTASLGTVTDTLNRLEAREGVAVVLGNHDHWAHAATVGRAVSSSHATLLRNAHITLRRDGTALYIVGVDDVWERQDDLPGTLSGIPNEAVPVVLLVHEPDFADQVVATGRVGLQLSGHSHGGQVRLPGIGAPILPPLGRKYDMGLFRVGDMQLYVNRGIGMTSPYVRFNCPPEITQITLVASHL